eukprot:CAMPEP_0170408230 /NCGR_PEP_ID=MMETSP0117_2-20130122/28678_1 /TAXON_ID=400756 /ORGANISM="Durinskia baltica, Strain CSIRO CS-38" /LENGTH=672 /DNA_ID=CAMNT_0010665547 /DNA_START=17 /DNA_END=2035 /DNA_ORIENTATION=-
MRSKLPLRRLISGLAVRRSFEFELMSMQADLVGAVDEAFESAVGITEFANSARGIQGIMKQRYSDFIVREVSLDGKVAYLNSLCGEELEKRFFSTSDGDNEGEAPSNEETVARMVQSLIDIAKDKVQDGEREKLSYFLTQCIEKGADCPESFVVFSDLDKPSRTAVHATVKTTMADFIETEATQVDGKSMIKMIAKHKRTGNQLKRKRAEWPSGLGNFLRFTLLKENIDTMNAVTILNNGLRCGFSGNGVTYSGTKDKRGVTVQKCTVYRRKPSDFARMNASKMTPTILCGDFEFVSDPAQLGDGGGNRFEIVLRALNTSNECEILGACQAMQFSGFVNYFGLQRFGKGGTRSHEIGRAILKSDWELCVSLLFTPRDGDRQSIVTAKDLFAKQEYSEALKVLPEAMHAEKCVLQRLVNKPTDFMSAYAGIPKNARLICAHAYQSYLWNKATSRRLQLYGSKVIVGDLVEVETVDQPKEQQQQNKLDGEKGATESASDIVRYVTEEDVACGRYAITDVVLPLPGYESVYPLHDIGAYYDELFAADGLTRRSYDDCHAAYRERGVYRKLIQAPKDFEWKAISYDDPDAELAETELVKFREAKTPAQRENATDTITTATIDCNKADMKNPRFWALQVKFSLPPGTYATMLLREITKSSTESMFQAQLTKDANSSM